MMNARQCRDRAETVKGLGRRTPDPEMSAAFASAARDWLALAGMAEVQERLLHALEASALILRERGAARPRELAPRGHQSVLY